ncbi:type VI immunity family protein [Vibrio quintilis]|uniref:DUF3396 domain-containing protein n=1 Tax=Vibrio quintilis TaxID=1117707 RepID=A0A1M7YRH8_9VIBR|nr:type VI immunity family protein [Vibrio quintilis]SHO55214.1 hypothetical protein VQ7734_00933 [Vibrio quintilis]
MEPTLEQQLQLIEPGSQQILMTVCLNVTLFFEGGYEKSKREAILSMFADYQQMMAGQLNFTTNPQTGRWKDLRQSTYMTPDKWLLDTDEDEAWNFIYHGGEHHRDASDIRFSVLGCGDWEEEGDDLSWVTINFPLTFFADYSESFQDVLLRWIGALQPEHGYAAIATTHNHYDNTQYERSEYQFAQQYPGLDIPDHIGHGMHLKPHIKGINWLTIIHQSYLDTVGGLDALKTVEGIQVWQQGDVYLIQAADKPALQHIPDSYYQLGALFEPIRVKEHDTVHSTEAPGEVFNTPEDYQEWLARFDQKPGAEASSRD